MKKATSKPRASSKQAGKVKFTAASKTGKAPASKATKMVGPSGGFSAMIADHRKHYEKDIAARMPR